ncbi:hypothetical protein CGH94_23765 [Vibrio parahaemolyticus]|nr:hypothetical protein CGH94_23765 [Vibrio parahaemolyticus]
MLFFEKGKRKLNDLGVPDVLQAKRVWKGYPTEKPVDLIQTLIEQSSTRGELVVDPFFGSGATLVAANSLDRKWAGTDISEAAHEHFSKRIS